MDSPTDRPAAIAAFRDVVVFWNVGERRTVDIVTAACDLLVAGVDGPALRELAAVSISELESEIAEPLQAALAELGLTVPAQHSDAARIEALEAMAARTISGRITAAELADWAHSTFSHAGVGRRLSFLSDDYNLLEYNGNTRADVDAQVVAEAQRIVAAAIKGHVPPGPTGNRTDPEAEPEDRPTVSAPHPG